TLPTPKPVDTGAAPAAPVVHPDLGDGPVANGASGNTWVNLDYLLWWTKKRQLPPLVTTGNPLFQGILAQPTTHILFVGPVTPDEEGRSGFRVTTGCWLDCEKCWGLEFSGFYFPSRDDERVFGSDLCSFLARPFFSLNECRETSEITSQPGLARGTTNVRTPLR